MMNLLNYIGIQLIEKTALPQGKTNAATLKEVFGVFYAIIGAVAFFLLVVAGLRYAINSNDPTKVAESKRMIAYTLVGLVVITLAAVIVQYVLDIHNAQS